MVTVYFEYDEATKTPVLDSTCSPAHAVSLTMDKDNIANHSCMLIGNVSAIYDAVSMDPVNSARAYRWYSGNDFDSSKSGSASQSQTRSSSQASGSNGSSSSELTTTKPNSTGISAGTAVGIVVAALFALAIICVFVVRVYRSTHSHTDSRSRRTATTESRNTISLEATINGQKGLWNDDVITTKRIPRDKVRVKKLIRRGAFGEVYLGTFNRQQVAIKIPLASSRSNLQQINAFLAEAKIAANMDHPHIVCFVGVAWDSLSDLCVVLEYMDGGDLRSLLNKYEASDQPVGFDRQKITIALHVCHALTYLHSLSPPMIRRDLKSRNILLSKAMKAKVTDFGVSRERLDHTMTAGVGTSLWMAPEVMFGE
ncbi:unnamed protein product [Phytophthora fragariaefolia]|uniref:Unnamed protein product n=1 Tax=Phytophthora fragariaefolia TaxID=1490495 RepID=A0A9W7CMA5_9STRA|nr:unnamed protein product [Phytophthora fragariaefolia]